LARRKKKGKRTQSENLTLRQRRKKKERKKEEGRLGLRGKKKILYRRKKGAKECRTNAWRRLGREGGSTHAEHYNMKKKKTPWEGRGRIRGKEKGRSKFIFLSITKKGREEKGRDIPYSSCFGEKKKKERNPRGKRGGRKSLRNAV